MFLYGKPLAQKIIDNLKEQKPPVGKFVVIQVGSNATSTLYVEKKAQIAKDLKIDFETLNFTDQISTEDLIKEIEKLNIDKNVKAVLVQIPLPNTIDRNTVATSIDPDKDIDGFNYIVGKSNHPVPPTVLAIVSLLEFYKIKIINKRIVIVGGGFLVGIPLYRYLKERSMDVTILHKDDFNYNSKLKSADIVITATGRSRSFSYSDFKKGATIIDASTVYESGATRGDIGSEGWQDDKNLAPVPGGLGPVTVAELFNNFFINK